MSGACAYAVPPVVVVVPPVGSELQQSGLSSLCDARLHNDISNGVAVN
jgi:hypothetical protein